MYKSPEKLCFTGKQAVRVCLLKYDGWTHLMQKPVFLPNFRRFSLAESEFSWQFELIYVRMKTL